MVKKRKNNQFDPEKEYSLLKETEKLEIDIANRVLMYVIENKPKDEIEKLFQKMEPYDNETTYSLMVRYYAKVNIDNALVLIKNMEEKNIKIKKRTLLPIFNKLCKDRPLIESINFFRQYIKKQYQLEEEDYKCMMKQIFESFVIKYFKTLLRSMKRNIREINTETANKLEAGLKKNKIGYQICNVTDGICNNVKLKSVDLKKKEIDIILSNIENNYAKDKKKDIKQYKTFLNDNPQTNVLLDGANIMFFIDRKTTLGSYNRLNTMYKLMKDLGYYPLIILHRRHEDYLEKSGLNKEDIRKVKGLYKSWKDKNCLYQTPYKMNDDWFFLYGSVYKENCMVVTNDHLRDHIFKISEKEIHEDILKKWIERRIIRYNFVYEEYEDTKKVTLTFPSEYSIRIQRIKGNWYIPISKTNKWLVIYLNIRQNTISSIGKQ
ncbi:Protein-only RNase P [seawater metagenome]|uniref:ribonuclease P n=1 Tax=seawater metagenome TaxID=1561972 RepID=A0A5E8CLH2_9ZZZZ